MDSRLKDLAERLDAGLIARREFLRKAAVVTGGTAAGLKALEGMAALLRVTPACLSPPHGEARPVCVAGEQVVWDGAPIAELEPALRRFAGALGLDCVQLALAPTAAGPAVIAVETRPYLEQFGDAARAAIVDAVVGLLT